MAKKVRKPTYDELLARVEVLEKENRGWNAFGGSTYEAMKIVALTMREAEDRIMGLIAKQEPVDTSELQTLFISIFTKSTRAMLNNRALLKCFGSGSEKLFKREDMVLAADEANAELQKVDDKLQKHTHHAVRLLGAAAKALHNSNDVMKQPQLAQACQTIESSEYMQKMIPERAALEIEFDLSNPEPMKYYGRQVSKCQLQSNVIKAQAQTMQCPDCGSSMRLVAEQLPTEKLKTLHADFTAELSDYIELQMGLWQCTRCKKVSLDLAENAMVPVLPNQTVAQDVIVNANHMLYHGMPMNRFSNLFLKPMALGSDTLSRLRLQFAELYEAPLWKAINEQFNHSVLLVDETTYPCLQTQGRGSCTKQAEGKNTRKNFVLVYSNPTSEKHQIRGYRYIGGRSAGAINEGLTGLNPEVFVTDGYGAYNKIIREKYPESKHQCCIVHFRRTILEALDFDQFKNETKELSDDELVEFFKKRIKNRSKSQALLLMVLDALSKIFSYERHLLEYKLEDENLESYWQRVKKLRQERTRPLMDSIDTLMQAVMDETKDYIVSPYAKAVTYYQNQREAMRYFLEDPRVPCHTNAVEQSVRVLVIARQATKFAQSEKGMHALCTSTSLIETAECNGIDNPVEWLCEYGRAFFKYCYEKKWQEELSKEIQSKNPEKRFQQWDFEALGEGFDYTPWLPWNWKARQK